MADARSQSFPDTTRRPNGFDLQGHRGARGLVPENTIPAFRRALELGVTTLEMDVVVSADGVVVVSHEPWMARAKCLTPDGAPIPEGEARAHKIYEMSYERIASYDCGRTLEDFPEQESVSAPKPRLRDVLQMAETYDDTHDRGPVFYNIETKSRPDWDGTLHPEPETFVRRVLAVVTAAGVAPRTTIQSFDPRTLEAAHRQNATVRIALLVGRAGNQGLDDNLTTLSFVPDIYSPNAELVDDALVSAVHNRGLALVPWTVNDPDAMTRLIRLGVDGLITDYPDRARTVLEADAL
ncbi:MAG: glycerophosphodiester phosphodiesterase family protein [Salinibacter sp.]|uniref:glycerophosphodiester phosphodiesterase family protein n=1 Tax=Salinibacter sp. TaxID=2065818 RepID=UPI002FC3AD7E